MKRVHGGYAAAVLLGACLLTVPMIVSLLLTPSPGIDAGNYLQVRNWVEGSDHTGLMPFNFRPPLIGVKVMLLTKGLSPWLWVAVWGGLASAVLLVFQLSSWANSPDHASYLHTRNWVFGSDHTGLMVYHFRPPVIGVLLAALTSLSVSDMMASKLMTLGATWLAFMSVYFLARVWLEPRHALWASVLCMAIGVPLTHNAIAGYLPTLAVGVSLILMRLVLRPERASWWGVPLAAFLLAGLNQTIPVTMALVLLTLPIWTRRQIALLALGVLATTAWWPFVLVSGGNATSWFGEASLKVYWQAGLARAFIEWNWMLLPQAFLITWAVCRGRSPVFLALVVSWGLSMLVINHVPANNALARFAMYMPVFLSIHLVWVCRDFLDRTSQRLSTRSWRPALLAALGMPLLFGIHAYTMVYNVDKYNVLTDARLAAVEYVGEHSAPTDLVASYPANVGHWVGGLTGRLWHMPWGYTPPLNYAEEYAGILCLMGITLESDPVRMPWLADYPCDPGHATPLRWLIVDFGKPDMLWREGYHDPRADRSDPAIYAERLREVARFEDTIVYKVQGPYDDTPEPVDRSTGRTWPWEAW